MVIVTSSAFINLWKELSIPCIITFIKLTENVAKDTSKGSDVIFQGLSTTEEN